MMITPGREHDNDERHKATVIGVASGTLPLMFAQNANEWGT